MFIERQSDNGNELMNQLPELVLSKQIKYDIDSVIYNYSLCQFKLTHVKIEVQTTKYWIL